MKRSFILLLGIFIFVTACGQPAPPPTVETVPQTQPPQIQDAPTKSASEVLPTVASACIDPEPAQTDIDRALGYTGNIFESPDWEKGYEVLEDRVTVYWVSSTAVVFLEDVIFPCGYEEPDLNKYFSNDHWDVVFGNYEGHALVRECRNDNGLRLYEFSVSDQGTNYDVRYWSTYNSENSIITLMLLLPAGSAPVMDEYSALLFPPLQNCN